jgi:hypothetical protein
LGAQETTLLVQSIKGFRGHSVLSTLGEREIDLIGTRIDLHGLHGQFTAFHQRRFLFGVLAVCPFQKARFTANAIQSIVRQSGSSQDSQSESSNRINDFFYLFIINAIFEYKAEREDELDVNIGDSFIIMDTNTTGWWVVEKNGKTGWGCLMENNQKTEADPDADAPIEGTVLHDYEAIGVNELSIKKGDLVLVHKTYQHWLLADCDEKQGWVPSCYVSITRDLETSANDTISHGDVITVGSEGDMPLSFIQEEQEASTPIVSTKFTCFIF